VFSVNLTIIKFYQRHSYHSWTHSPVANCAFAQNKFASARYQYCQRQIVLYHTCHMHMDASCSYIWTAPSEGAREGGEVHRSFLNSIGKPIPEGLIPLTPSLRRRCIYTQRLHASVHVWYRVIYRWQWCFCLIQVCLWTVTPPRESFMQLATAYSSIYRIRLN